MKKITSNRMFDLMKKNSKACQHCCFNAKRFSIVLFFFTSIIFGQSGACQAKLVVENNGNYRSSPLGGTYYAMKLTNTAATAETYSLSGSTINSSCTNKDGSSSANNVSVNFSFIDANKKAINEIKVDAGQTVNFYIHITVPIGTTINKWSCTQIVAESKTCANYKVETVLHTYVINSSLD